MKIKDIEINKTVLSPMAGVTDLAFRLICKEMGAGLVVTEMVSAKGLYYKDKGTEMLTTIRENERPVSLQIFGSDPDIMSYVIKNDLNFREEIDIIDINMGCPAPKIVKNGDGSALMKDPNLISKILEKCVKVSKKPLTIKIRSGWDKDSINAIEISKMAEESGIDAITVHGRTREMYYTGEADWDIIGEIKSRLKIPVIGNGDIFDSSDAIKIMEYTACDAVAIGRGVMGNPFLFKGINNLLAGEKDYSPTYDEILKTILLHMDLSCKLKGEKMAIKEMRKHIAWYLKGLKNSNEIKNRVNTMEKREEIEELLKNYFLN
ncbi:tRNA dihydrouridine synthase DusB [Tissierella creatinophila]|uniref:tRNA-dihydrouridine synthase n=1 Tax=Tissierella creatinophila DSM 6911 TaxID=1123403 RepID=A0A1U7M6R9_TISCR|nr:tRNA dihydrouridine synthase DusB [Tissierella creatinophila]OLS02997.1 tRNA-dihydrouridine synthase C [Tissierella creatinophila DSM 6911]